MSGRLPRTGRVLHRLLALLLLVPALVVTLARVLELDDGTAVRLVSFTPLVLPLYVVALLLFAVPLVVRRRALPRGRRTPLLVGLVVASVGVAVHAWWLSPQYLGDDPRPARGATTLTVMTSNLYEGKGDVGALVRTVREQDVDVLVLEEISVPALAAADAAGLAALLPNRIGSPDGLDPVAGTMVLAKEPLGTPTRVPTIHQSWWVDVGTGPSALRVLAVHPVAPVTVDTWRSDHDAILVVARASRPDVVLGDFNATADHQPMQALAEAGFRDVGELANDGWQPTWPANGISPLDGVPLPPLVRIDHVLVRSSMAAIGTRVVELPGSDHLALVAEIAVR